MGWAQEVCSKLLNSGEDSRRAASGEKGNEEDAAPLGFDGPTFVLMDRVDRVVPPFDVDVRGDGFEKTDSAHLGENADAIHTGQCGEDPRAIGFRDDRSVRPLELAHGIVAIEADQQGVPDRAGGFEIGDVTRVEQVETAIGDDQTTSLGTKRLAP